MKKVKRLAVLLVVIMMFTACGSSKESDTRSDSESTRSEVTTSVEKAESASEATEGGVIDGGETRTEIAEKGEVEIREETGLVEERLEESVTETESAAAEADVSSDGMTTMDSAEISVDGTDMPQAQIMPEAGLLTAGEWCDNQNWGFFSNLVTTGNFDFNVFGINPMHRIVVHALSSDIPVKNAKVDLIGDNGSVMASGVTDYSGMAYLFYNVFEFGTQNPSHVVVNYNGMEATSDLSEVKESHANEQQSQQGESEQAAILIDSREITVELASYEPKAKKLDVMFVFDTTGSMGDELLYLQKEFEDIANRIADQNTRFSVNFYRDLEDVYVVRSNEFTTDIQATSALINSECAMDGGDYPEAVDLALKNAVFEHDWNEDSVKLMFIILDAPPHDTEEVKANLQEVIIEAAKKGIRIIPIASSGIDPKTEGLLRDLAMLTGGTYTFLTDDSGIGGGHLEPTIGSYEVERLNDLIVRLVKLYYS